MSDHTPVYRALHMLENEYVPLLRRRAPYWRPRQAPCWRDVHLPDWSWTHPAYTPDLGFALAVLDRNAAFVSAMSSGTFAHGELEHTGAMPYGTKTPGYYKIDYHPWQDDRIVSPLGTQETTAKIWVAHPTLELLTQLCDAGYWPDVRIHDSWTCASRVRFREWATAVNNDRVAALRDVQADDDHDPELSPGSAECSCSACPRYKAVKDGYSMAVQLMLGPAEGGKVKSGVKRPDWYHTIHAQHAATTWRYVWKALQAGYEPVMMGSTDEVVYPADAVPELQTQGLLKVDDSGIGLGTFKVKEHLIPEAV